MHLSGDEVYCTNASLLLMEIMLRSQLHRQKVFKSKLLSYQIGTWNKYWHDI